MADQVRIGVGRYRVEEDSREAAAEALRDALAPLGGIGAFVGAGTKVLIKPNQTLFLPPNSGATTSIALVQVLIERCFEAGAKEVWVAEAAGHAQRTRDVMKNTGMASGVKDTGAHLIYLDEIGELVHDFGADAGALRYMPAPEILERADVIINVPKAKTHFVDPISCACKNWVGLIPMAFRLTLQRDEDPYYRATGLFLRAFKPALTVVDGAWAGEGQGPGGNEPFWWGWCLAGTDPVAMDVAVARLFGFDAEIPLRMPGAARDAGVGTDDFESVEFAGANFEEMYRRVRQADPSVYRFPCRVIVGNRGATMEGTLGHWKTIADGWLEKGLWNLFTLRGTPTFLFGDAEDPEFEEHVASGPYVVLGDDALDRYKYDPRVAYIPGSPVPQSYMQNEMVEGMGFGAVYRTGLDVNKMIQRMKGYLQAHT